jgi:putative ABC transport system permease protein
VFLAVRDLRFAKGRFLLMGAVVALVAVLAVILTGLATGLTTDNISALRAMPVTHLAFQQDVQGELFSRSIIEQPTWQRWATQPGVQAATPYGNSLTHATDQRGGKNLDIALFGVQPGAFIAPKPASGQPLGATPDGILISAKLAEQGVRVGDTLVVERAGTHLHVLGTLEEASFGHVAVAYAPLRLWQQVHYGLPSQPPPAAWRQATAVALKLTPGTDAADLKALDAQLGTHTVSKRGAYAAAPGYSAETGTMTLIRGFLYLISTLVVGAFFMVWTVQRKPEIALIKALGGSSRWLLGDAVTQVLVVLVAATGAGIGVGLALGAGLTGTAPFAIEPGPIALAAVLLVALGTLGTLAAVRRITTVDPLIALGGNR